MKFTLSWLKEHLDTTATLTEITDKLTAIGLELEELDNPAERFAPFTICHVISAEKHPDADKLRVCMVDTGSGDPVQVVCGAPNAATGMKGVFAPVGAYVPGIDLTLKAGNIRGQDSHGMLCSEREMELSDDHDGIISLPEDAPVGGSFATYRGLDDPMIEINLTPNRGDCAGVRGIARDLAAAGMGTLKPNRAKADKGSSQTKPEVHIETDMCPVFTYRLIKNVRNGPSPDWLQKQLAAIGQRSISALVDVTNWMTMDQCRPMHVFDADKLSGDLHVRLAQEKDGRGETMLALNGKDYTFDDTMVVIADDNGPVSLAGITGGELTGCTEETTNVLVEAAIWNPTNIARTGRKLDLHTDARFRFERSTDNSGAYEGMEIATQYILDMCATDKTEACEIKVAGKAPEANQTETFRPAEIMSRTGVEIDPAKAYDILDTLGFTKGKGDQVHVPSWRSDIQGEADLVEEVVRIVGFDEIPSVSLPPVEVVPSEAFDGPAQAKRRARRALASQGLQEAVTWSFMNEKHAQKFGEINEDLRLENPMSSELDYMRPSLLPNLIAAVGRNADRGFANVALFEVGTVFQGLDAKEQPQQAASIRASESQSRHWREAVKPVDLFDAKADAEAALAAAGAPANLQIRADAPSYFHPGRSGALALGKNVLAHFGEIHPRILKAFDVKGPVVGMELYFDKIPVARKKGGSARPLLKSSAFQPVERDFAFIVDETTAAETLLKAIKGADKKLITDVALFDVYQGKGIDEGKKSLAVAVTLQPMDASMTDEEIEAVSEKIIAAAIKATGAVLRG